MFFSALHVGEKQVERDKKATKATNRRQKRQIRELIIDNWIVVLLLEFKYGSETQAQKSHLSLPEHSVSQLKSREKTAVAVEE